MFCNRIEQSKLEIPSEVSTQTNSAHQENRTFKRYGFEILIFLCACTSPSMVCSPSMLPQLASAVRSSEARWKFATGTLFLTTVFGQFLIYWLINRYLNLPDLILMMLGQLLFVAMLYFIACNSRKKIAEVLKASSIFCSFLFSTLILAEKHFQDFVPNVVTPPPNL
jgi:hypothetical protein